MNQYFYKDDITEYYKYILKDIAEYYECDISDIDIFEGNGSEYFNIKGEYADELDYFIDVVLNKYNQEEEE